jgi:hypothetical protein
MAELHRHAAGQATYEVREIGDADGGLDLEILFRCRDYGQAVEFAFEYLGRRDPRRTGAVGGLQVIKDDGGRREIAWSYDPKAEAPAVDPIRTWGFDVTRRWTGPTAAPMPRPATLRSRVPGRV